uniref:Uncharacterized protein n=1 Tax=Arion vulgaris TaxID=1028688 RepID=A0A0B7A8B6_9EUPU
MYRTNFLTKLGPLYQIVFASNGDSNKSDYKVVKDCQMVQQHTSEAVVIIACDGRLLTLTSRR